MRSRGERADLSGFELSQREVANLSPCRVFAQRMKESRGELRTQTQVQMTQALEVRTVEQARGFGAVEPRAPQAHCSGEVMPGSVVCQTHLLNPCWAREGETFPSR